MKNTLLKKLYERKKYRFLYDFHNAEGQEFHVLEIKGNGVMGGEVYTYDPVKKVFFNYRSPHLFTYFAPHEKI